MHFDPSEGADWPYMVKKIEELTPDVAMNKGFKNFAKAINEINDGILHQ